MDLNSQLSVVSDVLPNSRVNVVIVFNDEYSLLIEGSFVVYFQDVRIFCSKDYTESDFDMEKLTALKKYIVNRKVQNVAIDNMRGSLSIVFENELQFNTYFDQDDFESWQLTKGNKTLISSYSESVVYN